MGHLINDTSLELKYEAHQKHDFISVFGLLVLVNYLRNRSVLKRSGGTDRIKDIFGSISSPISGNDQNPIKYN